MKTFEIELFDAHVDGLPGKDDLAVCFFFDGDIYTGWPLIAWKPSDLRRKLHVPPEQARKDASKVIWTLTLEESSAVFTNIRYWFRLPRVGPPLITEYVHAPNRVAEIPVKIPRKRKLK